MQYQLVEKTYLHCLSSGSNVRKEWMKFIFQTTSIRRWSLVHLILPWISLQTSHNSTRGLKNVLTKRRYYADYIGSDRNITTKCVFSLRDHYCFVSYYRSFDMYWVFILFEPKSQQRPSVKDVACQTYTTFKSTIRQAYSNRAFW